MPASKPALLAVIFIASAAVLIRSAILCDDTQHCEDYLAWALACAAISVVVCMVMLLLLTFKCANASEALPWVALFLVLLWIAGCGTMTFEEPYVTTGNGYFGAWIALIGSWVLLAGTQKLPRPWLAVLILASAVVVVQTAVDCGEDHRVCKDNGVAWVLICAVISLCICLVVFVLAYTSMADNVNEFWKWIALFLFLWWCAGTGVATYDKPYTFTGNGYFGCWVAVIAAAILVTQAFGQDLGSGPDDALQKSADSLGSIKEVVGVCLASLVVLIQAAIDCDSCKDYLAWALACAVISFVITLVIIIIHFFKLADIESFMKWIALFLAAWWAAGTGCMTFEAPYVHTGNAYFGAWAALIFAWIMCFIYWPEISKSAERVGSRGKEIAVLTLASLVVAIQASIDCADASDCKDQLAWAVACGWVSFVICAIVIILFEKIAEFFKWIVLFLFLWWAAGVGVLTFDKPYVFTGNAYFGSWVAFFMTVILLVDQFGLSEHVNYNEPVAA
eukprot:TRINITY_DN1521_c0_g1_i1.p1 TRINITY_DN1521_c0_g1~~TRINITY_DN1521_c0_g1_i1.p1  ORF type:complete len:539 (+),score=131.27 TRINITY_DN1521_c0_g1_i1:103-1617(+)